MQGIWRVIPSPAMTEIIAMSGFDYQIFDCEHGAYDYITLEQDIRACDLHNCAPYVRVSGLDQVQVQRCMDLGARGIVFPGLKEYDDFKAATKMVKYAPEGTRGFNPFVRGWGYGFTDGRKAELVCCIIVETLNAVDELDKILTLPGIDMIYIGSYDLSAQLGCIGEMTNPILTKVVDTIIEKCVNASVTVGLMLANAEQYVSLSNKGITSFVHTVDSAQLKKVFTNAIEDIKAKAIWQK